MTWTEATSVSRAQVGSWGVFTHLDQSFGVQTFTVSLNQPDFVHVSVARKKTNFLTWFDENESAPLGASREVELVPLTVFHAFSGSAVNYALNYELIIHLSSFVLLTASVTLICFIVFWDKYIFLSSAARPFVLLCLVWPTSVSSHPLFVVAMVTKAPCWCVCVSFHRLVLCLRRRGR